MPKPQRIDLNELPRGWGFRPHPRSTQEIGSNWALKRESLALAVPSARIPLRFFEQEYNLLINPFHPDFLKKVKVLYEEELPFQLNY